MALIDLRCHDILRGSRALQPVVQSGALDAAFEHIREIACQRRDDVDTAFLLRSMKVLARAWAALRLLDSHKAARH